MDKKKIKRFEDLLFEYFLFNRIKETTIGWNVVKIKYKHNIETNTLTLYCNKEPFFQTRNYRKLKQMLKLIFL